MPSTPPLAGLTVIELGHSVAAPFAGLVLAQLGADVVKVERPGGGDDARAWGPPFHDGTATIFLAMNRAKRSVAIDLKAPAGLARAKALVAGADVLIQNLKPGLAEELGLGAAEMTALNPRLVYASITAFGDTGPLAGRPGYDPLMQAFSGIMSTTGEPGRASVRTGPSVVDLGSGLWSVVGILAALLQRNMTGTGAVVGASLLETALGWLNYQATGTLATGRAPGKTGSITPMIAPYQAFAAADGEIVIAAGNDNLFRRLAGVLGHPEWPDESRFVTNPARVANREALVAAMAPILAGRTVAHWVATLDAVGVPCAPVQSLSEALAHPQVAAVSLVEVDAAGLRHVGLPVRLDGVRPSRAEPAPRLGQHDADPDLAAPQPSPRTTR